MNIRFLETLVWLARLKNFSRTAEKLNTTQPAISNRINKLEELLGVTLYDRAVKTFELTAAGRRILHYAEEIVALGTALSEAAVSDELLDIKLRIGVIEMVTMSWLPGFLKRIEAQFPKAIIEVRTDTTPHLVQMLREDELDLVFIIGPVNEPKIHSVPICTYKVDWVANPKIFDCSREIDIMDLSRMPIILTGQESSGYGIIVEYFRTYDINNIPSNNRNIFLDCVYSLGTAAHSVRSGLGIMVLPLFIFEDDLQDGQVAIVNVRQTLPPFYMTACYKYPVANRLIERLTEVAKEAASEFTESCNPEYYWV